MAKIPSMGRILFPQTFYWQKKLLWVYVGYEVPMNKYFPEKERDRQRERGKERVILYGRQTRYSSAANLSGTEGLIRIFYRLKTFSKSLLRTQEILFLYRYFFCIENVHRPSVGRRIFFRASIDGRLLIDSRLLNIFYRHFIGRKSLGPRWTQSIWRRRPSFYGHKIF